MNNKIKKTSWQPIETIPLDQYVDIWVTSKHNLEYGQRVTNACKSTSHSDGWIGIEKWMIPTHYMLLPQPPI